MGFITPRSGVRSSPPPPPFLDLEADFRSAFLFREYEADGSWDGDGTARRRNSPGSLVDLEYGYRIGILIRGKEEFAGRIDGEVAGRFASGLQGIEKRKRAR